MEGGKEIFSVNGQDWDLVKAEGAEKDADGYIQIEPQRIEWDRNGGDFSGTATVEVTTRLVGPSGKLLGNPVSSKVEVEIGPGETGETGP